VSEVKTEVKTFDFTVILAGKDDLSEDDAEKLFETGCDDGTPGVSNQVAMIHFSRDAASFQEAIVTAKADIERAGFKVAHVEIGASDITLLESS
jgi:hypothetical protein